MSRRVTKKRSLRKYAVGDMRERIVLHTRSITPPNHNSATFTESYDAGTEVWAEVRSLDSVNAGQAKFDNVQIEDKVTDTFVIRYRSWVTTETIIRWRGDAYEIKEVVDPDRRKMYLVLKAKLLGDFTKAANT